ncbi:MAG TPA: hypothetical protein VFM93_00780 [Candidatus Limnocylindria bacterium]|nr:hypothetical protein [Candidatus Limnocylindria bacterium]
MHSTQLLALHRADAGSARSRAPARLTPVRFTLLATAAFAAALATLVAGAPAFATPDLEPRPHGAFAAARVALAAPRLAAPGTELRYAVTVTDAAPGAVGECAAYQAALTGPDGPAAEVRARLACAPRVAPGIADTYALRLSLPEDLPPGEYVLAWRLVEAPLVAATRSVRVEAAR